MTMPVKNNGNAIKQQMYPSKPKKMRNRKVKTHVVMQHATTSTRSRVTAAIAKPDTNGTSTNITIAYESCLPTTRRYPPSKKALPTIVPRIVLGKAPIGFPFRPGDGATSECDSL